jgi:hypothetical protein
MVVVAVQQEATPQQAEGVGIPGKQEQQVQPGLLVVVVEDLTDSAQML